MGPLAAAAAAAERERATTSILSLHGNATDAGRERSRAIPCGREEAAAGGGRRPVPPAAADAGPIDPARCEPSILLLLMLMTSEASQLRIQNSKTSVTGVSRLACRGITAVVKSGQFTFRERVTGI